MTTPWKRRKAISLMVPSNGSARACIVRENAQAERIEILAKKL